VAAYHYQDYIIIHSLFHMNFKIQEVIFAIGMDVGSIIR
jgi:hypothetical protein